MATEATFKATCPSCSTDTVSVPITIDAITVNPLVVMLTVPPFAAHIACEKCGKEVTGSVTLRRIPSSAPFTAIQFSQNLKLVPRPPSLATSGGSQFDPT